MKAIILAAGGGTRLGLDTPKCMADIAGISIIHRQLQAFRAVGVNHFIIVVGYKSDLLKNHLKNQTGQFTFINNPIYAKTNTIHSLYLARQHLDQGSFYANADVVFDKRLPVRLNQTYPTTALAVNTETCAEEEVKVIVKNNLITNISKTLDPALCLGEFVGVAYFSSQLAQPFQNALQYLVEQQNIPTDYCEKALDHIAADQPLPPIDISDLPCREIDFPQDLKDAREQLAPLLID